MENVGSVRIKGNGHPIEIEWEIPGWSDDGCEACFKYCGETYFLSEFIHVDDCSPLCDYDGIHHMTYDSGLLIKMGDKDGENHGECLRVYRFY